MRPDVADLLQHIREEIEALERDVFAFQERGWVLTGQQGQDVNHMYVQELTGRIGRLQAAVARHENGGVV